MARNSPDVISYCSLNYQMQQRMMIIRVELRSIPFGPYRLAVRKSYSSYPFQLRVKLSHPSSELILSFFDAALKCVTNLEPYHPTAMQYQVWKSSRFLKPEYSGSCSLNLIYALWQSMSEVCFHLFTRQCHTFDDNSARNRKWGGMECCFLSVFCLGGRNFCYWGVGKVDNMDERQPICKVASLHWIKSMITPCIELACFNLHWRSRGKALTASRPSVKLITQQKSRNTTPLKNQHLLHPFSMIGLPMLCSYYNVIHIFRSVAWE